VYIQPFYGNYDGKGYVISNLYINKNGGTDDRIVSFFGSLKNANINSVHLKNILYLVENCRVSSFCDNAFESNISNSSTTGTIIVNNKQRTNAYGHDYIGYSSASGFVNQALFSTIENCFSEVDIISKNFAHNSTNGFISTLFNSVLSNSYYRGTMVNPTRFSTGLIGNMNDSKVEYCYSVVNTNSAMFGITWNVTNSNIKSTYFLKSRIIQKPFPKEINTPLSKMMDKKNITLKKFSGKGLSNKTIKVRSSFKEWNFDDIWAIDNNINDGLPYLRNMKNYLKLI